MNLFGEAALEEGGIDGGPSNMDADIFMSIEDHTSWPYEEPDDDSLPAELGFDAEQQQAELR